MNTERTTSSTATVARRRTKILATLNPDNITSHRLEAMIQAGMDASRHNLSHGLVSDHIRTIALVREVSEKMNKPLAVVVDLQGPKLRILSFRNKESIELKTGLEFVLDANCGENEGDENHVGLDYKNLVKDVAPGDVLALADGLITLEVKAIQQGRVVCKVSTGGQLAGRQGINKVGGGLSAPALTEKDRSDIAEMAPHKPDYFALSFVKSAEDIRELRRLLQGHQCNAGIIAKIECREALAHIKDIVRESDIIMIARGDLGVEVGDAHLPGYQKQLIKRARTSNRCVITATQMMETMTNNPIPTRAEVFDVANAVLDGTDVVMLSGETAKGRYPVKVIQTMANIVVGAEQERRSRISHHRMEEKFRHVEETIAMSAMFAVNHHSDIGHEQPSIKAILTLTESGLTPVYMSRISSGVSIYAFSPNKETVQRLTLYRGIYPVHFVNQKVHHEEVINEVVVALREKFPDFVKSGDRVLVTKGAKMGLTGGTNLLQIVTVP